MTHGPRVLRASASLLSWRRRSRHPRGPRNLLSPRFARSAILVAITVTLSAESRTHESRYPRFAFSLLCLPAVLPCSRGRRRPTRSPSARAAEGRQGPREGKGSPAAELHHARRLDQGVHLAVHRPGQHGRPHHRHLRLRGRPDHLLGRHRLRRPAQDDQQRRHLRAPVRQGGDRLHRRRLRRPVGQEHRLGRHRREQPAQLRLLRRRRLQVHRRRQELEEHGAEEDLPDRQDRHPPEEPGHRLRRRPRPALRPERGARPVQDDRRRQDLGQGLLRRRQDRRHRHADAPDRPGHAAVAMWERRRDEFDTWPGGGLPDGYDAYDPVKKWGTGRGHLQDHRRRQDVQEADQRAADLQARPHRPRLLPQGPERRLRRSSTARRSAWARRPRRAASRATPYLGMPRRGRAKTTAARRSPASSPDGPGRQGRPEGRRRRHQDRATRTIKTYDDLHDDRRRRQARRQGRSCEVKRGEQGRDDRSRPTASGRPARAAAVAAADSAARAARPARGPTRPTTAARPRTSRTSRARTATSTAASTSPPTAARPGRASTASTRGRCTSARSASIRPTTSYLYVLRRRRCTARATAARRSSRRRPRRPRRPARPVDRPEGRPAHDHRHRRRLLRHLRPRRRTGTTSTTWRSASSTTSPSATRSRTGSTAACRTTAPGAGRA